MERLLMSVRALCRSALLVAILLAARVDGAVRTFLGMKVGAEGAVWMHGWSRRIVRALGIEMLVDGSLPECGGGGLAVVSNHLGYLEVLLYSALRPFIMVAKSEVRGYPLLGWLTAQAGTVFVERANVKGGRTQTHAEVNAAMAEAFRSGLPVVFFPEGTTTDGGEVLPFRRGLFHSVLYDRVPVKTAALAFELTEPNCGATVENDVCFWGEMPMAPHIFGLLRLRGVRARMRFGEDVVRGEDRFALAVNSREQIVEMYAGLRDEVRRTSRSAETIDVAETDEVFETGGLISRQHI